MTRKGVVVSVNSDSDELQRHLNLEAAKTMRYGGMSPKEALAMVTINPAKQLGIDDPSCVKRYTERQMSAYEHAWEIWEAYGYRRFEDECAVAEFDAFLRGRARC